MTGRRRGIMTRRRGAGFLWFILVGLPFFFLAAFIAVDASRLFLANREVINAVEAAAIAGSFTFQKDTAKLDTLQAQNVALSVVDGAQGAGALRHVAVTQRNALVDARTNTVVVTVDYQVRNLTFVRVLSVFFAGGPSDDVDGSVTRAAFLCNPGTDGIGSENICTRPL